MKWFWGFLLIALGVAYLGPILGFWSNSDVNQFWQLWPFLLILFGLNLIVRRSKAAWIVMLLAFLLAGLFAYQVSFGKNTIQSQKREERAEMPRESSFQVDAPSGIENATVEINTGAVELDLKGGSEKLVNGKLTSSFAEPRIETNIENKSAKVRLSTVSFSRRLFFRELKNFLEVKLGKQVPTMVKIDSGASKLNLDFTDVRLAGLDLNTGASSANVKIGNNVEKDARLSFEAGASDIDIEYAKGLGVRIESESGLVTEDFEGFTKKDGYYENPEFATAEKKITIVLKTGASSVRVKAN